MSGRAYKIVLAALAALCLLALWRVVAAAGLQVPLDPNEGWNAYHAAAAIAGGPLYPAPQSYMVNNYPPLSFYLVGAAGLLTGDNILAGRIISLLAFAAIAAGMYAAARKMGASRAASAFAPLFFAAALLLFTDYVGMDDPQLLAHAVAMGGFLLVLREPHRVETLGLAAFAFVAAFFIKHNVVAMGGAATLWLLVSDRNSGVKLAAFGLGLLFAGLAVFHLIYGRSLLSVVDTPRAYSLALLETGASGWLAWTLVPLAGLGYLLLRHLREPPVRLCAVYAVLASVIGLAFLGGVGVDPNVLFDADIALALSAALVLDRLSGWRAAVVAAAAVAPLFHAAAANEDWRDFASWLHPLGDEAATARADIAMMAHTPGATLCEMQSFCYWAGKPPAVDVFNVGQQFDTGARSDTELAGWIGARRYSVIQFDPDSPDSLGQNVHDAMARAYRLHHSDDFGSFWVPR